MKRVLLAAALCVLALAGCDTFRGWMGMPTNDKPVVKVINGQISVSPDPLEFARGRRDVVIIWTLDDSATGFRFADADGIRVEKPQREFDNARVIGNGRQFQVINRNTMPGTYKYTINLIGPNGRVALDPTIVNME